jgi:hypothetical protein
MPITKSPRNFALRLTQGERNLLFEDRLFIPARIRQIIRKTPLHELVELSIGDWETISGWLASEANHTSDKKWERQLDRLFQKIPV